MSYTRKMRYLIDEVKAHAVANYNSDGWDMVVEAMTEAEIAEALVHDMWTRREAIRLIGKDAKTYHDHRGDIQAEAF